MAFGNKVLLTLLTLGIAFWIAKKRREKRLRLEAELRARARYKNTYTHAASPSANSENYQFYAFERPIVIDGVEVIGRRVSRNH